MSEFKELFDRYKSHLNNDFEVIGMVTRSPDGDRIFPLPHDAALISKWFELVTAPIIYQIGRKMGRRVFENKRQNKYPDFTLINDADPFDKIAIDVKSSYRRFLRDGISWYAEFTLGSATKFRNPQVKSSSAHFPMAHYREHWVIGYIYSRRTDLPGGDFHLTFPIEDREKVECPIADVRVFCQEMYRIAGEMPGSRNTANIGSIRGTSVEEFDAGQGPFATRGFEYFQSYWSDFDVRSGRAFSNIPEYDRYLEERGKRHRLMGVLDAAAESLSEAQVVESNVLPMVRRSRGRARSG